MEDTTASASASARAEWLDAILNTTADGVIVIDTHGRIESFNRAATALFGFQESEVLGRNVSLLMPSPHQEHHDEYLAKYLSTGEAHIIGVGREVIACRRDGTQFPVHLSVGEMRIAGERKFTGVLHDLSKRAKLSEDLRASEARWSAVVQSAVDGIVVIDAHGRIEAFNPAAERLFGYSQDEVRGKNVNLLMPSPFREEHDGYMARYLATRSPRIIGIGREVQGRRKDGGVFPVHLSVGEMTIDGEQKFTGILHDLSARVRMEEKLREQAALAKLGEMAAVIAHEVKNPLAGIRGAIEVVGNRLAREGSSVPILKDIVARIDSLDQMMKDMLLFARPPKPELSPTDIVPLIKMTADLLRQDPALRDVAIAVEGSAPPVPADQSMLTIVCQNLLLNGAHAMHGKGAISVEVSSADSVCTVVFADTGPGIPAAIRDKVFEPFFTTKARGSGLGLPTVKRLVDVHKGEVAIDCPPSGGTRVTIRLPLAPPA